MSTKIWDRMVANEERKKQRERDRDRKERRDSLMDAMAMSNFDLLEKCLYDYEAHWMYERVLRRRLRLSGFLPQE